MRRVEGFIRFIDYNNYGRFDRVQKIFNENGTIQAENTWVDGELIKTKEY